MLLEYDDIYDKEDDMDFSDFDSYEDEQSESFAQDMLTFLNDIIQQSSSMNEEFTSQNNLRVHFRKHCLGHSTDKHSTPGRVYYDFTDNSQYVSYEKKITDDIRNTDMIIDSLDDYDSIMKYMRNLFRGNCTVVFTKNCGLQDNKGHISVSFSSYATDVTSNYSGGNTINVCIKGKGNRTVSLYAVDVHKVQSRLNNIIKNNIKYGNAKSFQFNND